MTLAVASTSSARNVRSRRFPSGVATTYNVLGRARNTGSTSWPVGSPLPAATDSPPATITARPVSMSAASSAMPLRRALRRSIGWLAVASLAVAAAFSAAQTPAASDIKPEVGDAAGPAAVPEKPPVDIAVVLPLNVAAYARAAEAVSAGFIAGAAGGRTTYVVIPHAEDGVLGAFEAARQSGAKVIVGPLVRDDLRTIAQAESTCPGRSHSINRRTRQARSGCTRSRYRRERCAHDRAAHAGRRGAERRDRRRRIGADEALRRRVRHRMAVWQGGTPLRASASILRPKH